MTTPYYTHGGSPAQGSAGSSATIRAEFDSVEAGFAKLPTLSGNAGKAVRVNATETALEAYSATYDVGAATHGASAKTTPVDTDELPISDSASAYALAKVTWANIKATLKTYLDTLYVAFTSSTGSAKIPAGTTGQRDGSPAAGYFRYNSSYGRAEMYSGTAWAGLGGASGAGGDDFVYENTTTVTTDYTLTTGKNGMTAGPIQINAGVTITVPAGSTWTIV